MLFPWTVLEKPHCGLIASWSMGTKRDAASIRRSRMSTGSSSAVLLVTSPRTSRLPFGSRRSGEKSPARGVSNSRK